MSFLHITLQSLTLWLMSVSCLHLTCSCLFLIVIFICRMVLLSKFALYIFPFALLRVILCYYLQLTFSGVRWKDRRRIFRRQYLIVCDRMQSGQLKNAAQFLASWSSIHSAVMGREEWRCILSECQAAWIQRKSCVSYFKEIGCEGVDWINPTQDRDQWRSLVR